MSIADTGRFWEILVIPVFQILEESRKYRLYQYCRYWKILENTGNTSIADAGRFWKILVICDTVRLGTKLRNVLVYCFFLSILVLPVLLDEEYWSFQYCVLYNTSITSIAG
jgi:hypothetical protein